MKQTVDDAVVFECDLPESRDKVWRALTQKELLAAWLLPNDMRPEVGAKFQLGTDTECEVLEAQEGRKLRWRQQEPASSRYLVESVVSFELADLPAGGTHLRVVHDGFATVTRAATVLRFQLRTKAAITSMSGALRWAA